MEIKNWTTQRIRSLVENLYQNISLSKIKKMNREDMIKLLKKKLK